MESECAVLACGGLVEILEIPTCGGRSASLGLGRAGGPFDPGKLPDIRSRWIRGPGSLGYMIGIYAFAAIIGWPFLLFFVFFGGDGGDADLDVDADVDVDLEVDPGEAVVAAGAAGGVAAAVLSLISFRTLVFFLAFFGATGLILTALSAGSVVTLVAALAIGLFVAGLNAQLFRLLKSSSVESEVSDRQLAGAVGRVTIPISTDSIGRIICEVAGQSINLTASPFDAGFDGEFGVGESVVVVEVRDGEAKVASIRELTR